MSVSVGSCNERRFPGRIRARRNRQPGRDGDAAARRSAGDPDLVLYAWTRRARSRRLSTQPELRRTPAIRLSDQACSLASCGILPLNRRRYTVPYSKNCLNLEPPYGIEP
jgi:hypothetical protein